MRLIAAGGVPGGRIQVPGDKSISHRAALIGALASGCTDIDNFLDADDCLMLLQALAALGIRVEQGEAGRVRIHGQGDARWPDPGQALELGNSGTAMRLLAGVLAGRGVKAELRGDASLSTRPMERITQPLEMMGARIRSAGGTPPLQIEPAGLRGIEWTLQVPSAQVKSCLLFAGLHAAGTTRVHEPVPARDHTERLLEHFGIPVDRRGDCIAVQRCDWSRVPGRAVTIAADPSSAAFFITCAAMSPGSDLTVAGVCTNPHRTGFIRVLGRMGARIDLDNEAEQCGEPVADIRVRGKALAAVDIGGDEIVAAIDELPLLMIAAAAAHGTTRLRGAGELRYKESDRIRTMASLLADLGIRATEYEDGLDVEGGAFRPGRVHAAGDHRIALAAAAASVCCDGPVEIEGAEAIATSFPRYPDAAQSAGMHMKVRH